VKTSCQAVDTDDAGLVTVPVYGDGRCFFRCVSKFMLRNCTIPMPLETVHADLLREDICKAMCQQDDILTKMCSSCPFLLEKTFNCNSSYVSINERIRAMSCSSTFVGNVEIMMAAYFLRTQIHIYQSTPDGLAITAKLPQSLMTDNQPVRHLYHEDNYAQPGHFDLLVENGRVPTAQVAVPAKPTAADIQRVRLKTAELCNDIAFQDIIEDHVGILRSKTVPSESTSNPTETCAANTANSESQQDIPEGARVRLSQTSTSATVHVLSDSHSSFCDEQRVTQSECEKLAAGAGDLLVSDGTISYTHRNGRRYVSCTVCTQYADVVRIHAHRGRLPAIATEFGTVNQKEIVADHLASPWHAESMKCARLCALNRVERTQHAPMDKHISKANEKLANKVGGLMITAFNDAKKLTLSAHSWPSRIVAAQKASTFDYNSKDNDDVKFDLQYVTPQSHSDLLRCIVETHRQDVLRMLIKSKALSLRADGSVDRTQIDKIYVLAKSVDEHGNARQVFLGTAEPQQRGAVGVVSAVKEALVTNFGKDGLTVLQNISSVVTDDASVNIGEKIVSGHY